MGVGMVKWWVIVMLCGVTWIARGDVLEKIVLDYDTPVDAKLQREVEGLDARLREKLGMTVEQTAVGVMDLRSGRLALVRPDREEYAASVAKLGILLAYFDAHPEAAEHIDPVVERELG